MFVPLGVFAADNTIYGNADFNSLSNQQILTGYGSVSTEEKYTEGGITFDTTGGYANKAVMASQSDDKKYITMRYANNTQNLIALFNNAPKCSSSPVPILLEFDAQFYTAAQTSAVNQSVVFRNGSKNSLSMSITSDNGINVYNGANSVNLVPADEFDRSSWYTVRVLLDYSKALYTISVQDTKTSKMYILQDLSFNNSQVGALPESFNELYIVNGGGQRINLDELKLSHSPVAPFFSDDNETTFIGDDISYSYTENNEWEQTEKTVAVNGITVQNEQYSISDGKFTLDSSSFEKAGNYIITIDCEGYSQVILNKTIFVSIKSVKTPDLISVRIGTSADDVYSQLPQNVTVVLEDESTTEIPVVWERICSPAYDAYVGGVYTYSGKLSDLPDYIVSDRVTDIKQQVKVVTPDKINIKSSNQPETVRDAENTDIHDIIDELPETVNVMLEDGSYADVYVSWLENSQPQYSGEKGEYTFYGELIGKPSYITNDNNIEIKATVVIMDEIEMIVSSQTGIRTTPNARPFLGDGDIMGNGDILVGTAGTIGNSSGYYVTINKTDFYCEKYSAATENTEAQRTKTPAIVGKVYFKIGGMENAQYLQEQDVYNGEVRANFTKDDKNVVISSRTVQTFEDKLKDSLFVSEVTNNSDSDLTLEVSTTPTGPNNGGAVNAGVDGDVAWTYRKPGSVAAIEKPDWKPTFMVAGSVATKIFGADSDISVSGSNTNSIVTIPANSTVTVVSRVESTGSDEPTLNPADPTSSNVNALKALTIEDIANYNQEHKDWWRNYWEQSYIELKDEDLLEQYYYGAQYLLASANRTGYYAPGIDGWWDNDMHEWNGDYTMNYNIQSPYYGIYTSNRQHLGNSYYKAVLDINERDGKVYAQKNGKQGTFFRTHYIIMGLPNIVDHLGQKTNAVEAAANFIKHYYYTYDTEFLEKVYPFFVDIADFWDNDLVKEETDDGGYRYSIVESNVSEGSGYEYNAVTAVAYLKMFYKAMIEFSGTLGVDGDRVEKWTDIYEHLSDYPLVTYMGRTGFSYSESNPRIDANNYGYNLYPVFPSLQEGASSKYGEICRYTLGAHDTWYQQNSFVEVYPAAVYAGFDADYVIDKMNNLLSASAPFVSGGTTKTNNGLGPDLFIKQPGGGVETVGSTEAINAMLVQSDEGFIEMFPNWNGTDAKFKNLRQRGAFLVDGEIKDGICKNINITSEKGRDCTVLNPWAYAEKQLLVRDTDGNDVQAVKDGNKYTFKTELGKTYIVSPQGGLPSSAPQQQPKNTAMFRNVTASSSLEGSDWSAKGAVNNYTDSVSGNRGYSSNSSLGTDHEEWYMIDLENSKNICRVDIYPRNDKSNVGAGFPVDFSIEISNDNVNWETVAEYSEYPTPTDGKVQQFEFEPINARYVRLTAHKLSKAGSDYRLQFAEIQVMTTPKTFGGEVETPSGAVFGINGISYSDDMKEITGISIEKNNETSYNDAAVLVVCVKDNMGQLKGIDVCEINKDGNLSFDGFKLPDGFDNTYKVSCTIWNNFSEMKNLSSIYID